MLNCVLNTKFYYFTTRDWLTFQMKGKSDTKSEEKKSNTPTLCWHWCMAGRFMKKKTEICQRMKISFLSKIFPFMF